MHPLDRHFRDSLTDLSASVVAMATTDADKSAWWWGLFEAQATSRHLDFVARELQQAGRGFYTIGSAGHESNAMVALASRTSDPALLHYRSGAFYVARARQVPGSTPVRDVLQGLMGLADEPIAGWSAQGLRPSRPGRHPADLHGCLSSPEGCWSGYRAASGTPAQGGLRVARGRGRGVLVRRRLGEPLHRSRRHQHRPRYGLPRPAGTDSVRLRGQRLRHLGADAEGLDRGGVRVPARAGVRGGRRL